MFNPFKSKARGAGSQDGLNAAQAAGALAALESHRAGNFSAAEKMLNRHGLTLEVAEAYAAAVSQADAEADETVDEAPAAPPPSTAGGVERTVVAVPNGYTDTVAQRAKLIALLWARIGEGWQIESFDKGTLTAVAVRGELPSIRPNLGVYQLGKNATVSNREASAAEHAGFGRTMVGYNPHSRKSEAVVLPPATIELRERLLRKNPRQKSWELEILPIFGVRDGEGYLAKVYVQRADQFSPDREKEFAYWLGLARNTIGHQGWWVKLDDRRGTVEMIASDPLRIPSKVGYDYHVIEAGKWSELVIGRDGYNKPVIVDLSATPHALVVGRTGSGKSICLQTLAFSALVHGFELAVVDPTKRGLDFRWARPYIREGGWGCASFPEARATLDLVYSEAQRRVDILDELGVPKWTELTPAEQAEYGFKPILVVVDEGTSLSKMLALPKSMDKDDPTYVKRTKLNAAKEQIVMVTGDILRECRFVGIHLVFGTQRFGTKEIGEGAGEMRENMGARIILGRTSTTSLAMACADPQDAAVAYEQAHGAGTSEEDPADSVKEPTPGRGLAEIDGRPHVALQGAYAPVAELTARLELLGVPRFEGDRRPVVDDEEIPFSIVPAPAWERRPSQPAVKDLGEMTLDLNDLEVELDDHDDADEPAAGAEATPEPAWAHRAADDPEDPFGASMSSAKVPSNPALDEDNPFAAPVAKKKSALSQVDDFPWD